jgi:perosamine synthetase
MINYGKQYIDDDDIEAVSQILKSDFITTGPIIEEFEGNICNFTGYDYCSVVSSGTAALHCAMAALNIKPGDEVIVPAMTFIATANAVRYLGGTPIFADVDLETLLIDIESIKNLITDSTIAVIAMDYAGQQCDYKELKKLCEEKGLFLIADACHSFGAIKSEDKNQLADLVCYSFHPVKHITTGEGGAVLSKIAFFDNKIKSFRNHGRYEHFIKSFDLGYNYRMSTINAALGISQLKKISSFLEKRKLIAQRYDKELSYCNLKKIHNHVYHLYVIKVRNRDLFIQNLNLEGINCVVHYSPVYEHPIYQEYFKESFLNCPNTEKIKKEIVSLPIFYNLTSNQQQDIIKAVKENNPKEV